MGKLHYTGERNGYEFISDKGIKYDLYDGKALKGTANSDMIFIVRSYNEEIDYPDECVGFVYGSMYIEDFKEEVEEEIDRIVNNYEKGV